MNGDQLLERVNIVRDYLETMPSLSMKTEQAAIKAMADVEAILGFHERRKGERRG